ncbi:MAG: NAD(P)/FAD-dependent oxidoreductase [Candidatus Altiarchaeota archaeon]|nr:NAD(P)/FAD-dependent oxidoreductase [Candidatus Altiarchaeota archaeon]
MISVIGAGPIGSVAAEYCSKRYDTVLFESRMDRRIQCAGLVSKSGLDKLEIKVSPSSPFLQNSVRGARIFSPSGIKLEVDGGRDKAFVVDRPGFDDYLRDKAVDSGAKFINENVDGKNIDEVIKKSEKLVIATGTNYKLHKVLNLEMPHEFLTGAQYEMRIDCDNDFVELYFNVPGFFSWIIPVEGYARVGLCTRGNPVPYLDGFIKKLRADGRVLNEKILNKNFGIIPIYDPKIRTQYEKIAVVGDAASQVKATTGGGVVMGCTAAKFVCERDYEKQWRSEIGKELHLHLLIRRFLDKLSDKNLDNFFTLLNENREVIEREGDMDEASKLLYAFLKKPRFMAKFLLQTPCYINDML